ncbi:deoxyuridine 5'-triphosphate nucleotidohydrolase, mitochondrial, partial [Microcaecilia unicolor]|uniref:dUTP diphosphatase n=1 Tax=Microcaecilia unicolor TaxID=1415580 RepID=A0A6P7X7V1_9AMPH
MAGVFVRGLICKLIRRTFHRHPDKRIETNESCSPPKQPKGSQKKPNYVLRFVKLSENACTPTKGSAKAAGYDLYSAYDYVIPAMDKAVVNTDIQIALPSGCYGRVA